MHSSRNLNSIFVTSS